jgi:hypothetical protein
MASRKSKAASPRKTKAASPRKSKRSASSGAAKSGSGRRYGQKAQTKVKRSMDELKHGTLRSGRSGRRVTSRKQAIAIGLSEARREGGKVPSSPSKAKSKRGGSRSRKSAA